MINKTLSQVIKDGGDWRQLGECTDSDPELFFSKYEKDEDNARQRADEMCMRCPVIQECDEYATMAGENVGHWGGIYRTRNGKIDWNRNSHKTEEDWELLEHRLGRDLDYKEHVNG